MGLRLGQELGLDFGLCVSGPADDITDKGTVKNLKKKEGQEE